MINRAMGKREIQINPSFLSGLSIWPDLGDQDAWYYSDLLEAGVAHTAEIAEGKSVWTGVISSPGAISWVGSLTAPILSYDSPGDDLGTEFLDPHDEVEAETVISAEDDPDMSTDEDHIHGEIVCLDDMAPLERDSVETSDLPSAP